MARAAKRDWLDKALEASQWDEAAQRAADALMFLLCAPVPPPPSFPPIELEEVTPTIRVTFEPVDVQMPERNGRVAAYYGEHGDWTDAMRDHLVEARDYGPQRRVAALLPDGRTVVLQGSEAAIRQALPDQTTLDTWGEAGAKTLQVIIGPGNGRVRDVVWVPLQEAPRALQLELESRAIPALA